MGMLCKMSYKLGRRRQMWEGDSPFEMQNLKTYLLSTEYSEPWCFNAGY